MTKSVLTPDILLLESQDEILVLNVWLLLSLQSCRQTAHQENDYFGKFKTFLQRRTESSHKVEQRRNILRKIMAWRCKPKIIIIITIIIIIKSL